MYMFIAYMLYVLLFFISVSKIILVLSLQLEFICRVPLMSLVQPNTVMVVTKAPLVQRKV